MIQWVQDPAHASESGSDVRSYRTYFDYDGLHRPIRSSAPESTRYMRGLLIWKATEFDALDNVITQVAPAEGFNYPSTGARTTFSYDAVDRPLQITGPDTSADPMGERTQFQYDAAGRLTRTIAPQGVHSGIDKDHATDYSYDARDRVIKTTQYVLSGSTVTSTLNTLSCYDATRGDLPRVVAPKARLDTGTVHCSGTTVDPYTTQYGYDDAHRVTSTTVPTGTQTTTAYDAAGNVLTATQTVDRKVTPATSTTTIYTYDQADRQTVVQQTYDPTRTLTTKVQYDAAGNTTVVVPPRATDANPGLGNYVNAAYAATYHYDVANRLTQSTCPTRRGSPSNTCCASTLGWGG